MTNNLSAAASSDQELAVLRQRVADLEATVASQARDLAVGQSLRAQIPESRVFVFDTDLRYVSVDGPDLAAGASSSTQMIGHTIWEVLSPEAQAVVIGPYQAALQGETTTFTSVLEATTYRATVFPAYNATGQVIAGVALVTNVTAQASAEQRLRVFEQLVEHAPDGILVRGSDWHLQHANATLQTMLGYGMELNRFAIARILAPESHPTMAVINQSLQEQEVWKGRLVYQRADGTTFPGQATIFTITDPSTQTPLVGAIIRDASEQEAFVQERQEFQAHIIAAQEAIIRELATPLIPLADEVVMMPLVGTLDGRRMTQVMETLLEGIVMYQADVALLDVTGVTMIDTQVAQGLLRVTQAAKLLGTQIVLTGLSATIAMTLTTLGSDLEGVITLSTLQQGIAYAWQHHRPSIVDVI